MLCISPIKVGLARPFPCGMCRNCRINRRRDWTSRLLLEHCGHGGDSAFATMTYDEDHVPVDDAGRQVLEKVHVRNFLQRVRREVGSFRYVVCGEYGDSSFRPHYHSLLWLNGDFIDMPALLNKAWGQGFTHVGEVSEASISYTCAYLLKRMTKADDARLEGRPPEFARYSHGLGMSALEELKRVARPNLDGVLSLPREFRLEGKKWSIPKYLRVKLRALGYEFAPIASEQEESDFVSALRNRSRLDAITQLQAFREFATQELEARRQRSLVRSTRNLEKCKYETL